MNNGSVPILPLQFLPDEREYENEQPISDMYEALELLCHRFQEDVDQALLLYERENPIIEITMRADNHGRDYLFLRQYFKVHVGLVVELAAREFVAHIEGNRYHYIITARGEKEYWKHIERREKVKAEITVHTWEDEGGLCL